MTVPNRVVGRYIDMPDLEMCKKLYGIEFTIASPSQHQEFAELCNTLLKNQSRIASLNLCKLPGGKKVVYYKTHVFLSKKLTSTQVHAINERETHTVAKYCINIQSQLANVPIQESYERMLHLPTVFRELNIQATFSKTLIPQGFGAWSGKPQEFWTRESFTRRLVLLGSLLNTVGIQLHIEEAFRPGDVQEYMFNRRLLRTRLEHPNWDHDQIIAESKSKTASSPRLASHKAGAAVDVLLRSSVTGKLLDFGHKYPDGGVLVFPKTPYITQTQWQNRQLLQVAAGLCDLTLYVGEDWHLSYGDNLASLNADNLVAKDYIAKYGPVKEFDHRSGEILRTYSIDEIDSLFPIH